MTEDELRDRLRRADPAAGLHPLPPEQARRLIREAGAAPVPVISWYRRPVVLACGAALVAAAAVAVLLTGGENALPGQAPGIALPSTADDPGPASGTVAPGSTAARPTTRSPGQPTHSTGPGHAGTHASPPPSVTTSQGSGGTKVTVNVLTDSEENSGGRCPKPEAQHLAATARLAFEGTVLRVQGALVTLRVKRTWTGAETDLAEVRNNTGSTAILAGIVPEPGQDYLVAAASGQVMGCGYSGPAESELRALYDQAFPRR